MKIDEILKKVVGDPKFSCHDRRCNWLDHWSSNHTTLYKRGGQRHIEANIFTVWVNHPNIVDPKLVLDRSEGHCRSSLLAPAVWTILVAGQCRWRPEVLCDLNHKGLNRAATTAAAPSSSSMADDLPLRHSNMNFSQCSCVLTILVTGSDRWTTPVEDG
jgi:hypothetical protein